MANRLTVKLDGREYNIVSEESREYMLEIADMVNVKLAEARGRNCNLSTSMAALLVSLNMADDLKKTEMKYEKLVAEAEELKKRLEAARNYVQNQQKGQNIPRKN